MAYDLEEQEQLANLKAWWAAHGTRIVALVVIVLVAVAGWRGWLAFEASRAGKASGIYAQFETAANAKDLEQMKAAHALLVKDYGRSAYAALAGLLAARVHADAGDTAAARTALAQVIDAAPVDDMRALARVRLAGVQLDEKAYDDALKTLDAPHPPAFDALFADRRGDVYRAQGKRAEARQAYTDALAKLGTDTGSLRTLVQIKLDTLGEG